MPPIVNDWVAWSVGLSPSEPCRKFGNDRDTVCVQDSGGSREIPVAYSGPIQANTVLCSFSTIQPSSYVMHFDRSCSKHLLSQEKVQNSQL